MFPAIGSAARRYRLWVAVTALAAAACSDGAMSPENAPVLAKGGGGGGPSVNAADPNSASQDTTLEVRVIGSGFDEGSTVTFLLAGESTPKIVTNSSQFVSSDTLIANISVAADADTALYDIQVTTSRGKKGQGSELFQVTVKGGKPGEIVYVHTLHDLGPDRSLRAINDNGVMVGTSDGQAAVWWGITDPVPLLLPDPVGAGSWGTSVNSSATQVVGEYWNAAQSSDFGALWDINPNARIVLATRDLPPLAGYDGVTPSGLNDLGQVVGQSFTTGYTQQAAVIWEADGSGAMVPRALGDLSGHPKSWARGINNAGHIVGRSGGLPSEGGTRAVVWFLESDGSVSGPLDLTADSDDSGSNHALDVTEPVAGAIWISGYSSLAPDGNRSTVWKVDLTLRQVVEGIRAPIGGSSGRTNDALEVAVTYSDFNGATVQRGAVWEPATGVVNTLPSLSLDCNSDASDINGGGTLVGRSSVRVKARGGWSCVQYAVVWTKN